MENKTMVVNKKTKDSVFTKLFGETNYAFQLYKVFHPEDVTSTEEQINIITLENIFTNGPYNDLGLLLNDRLMLFVEAQSTWNDNMSIRTLLYLAETCKRYFITNKIDIITDSHITIPAPEIYVIFTGERKRKPEFIKLSDHFKKEGLDFNSRENSLELIVKMIYDSKRGDIVYQYIQFCKVFDKQRMLYKKDPKKVINETFKICKDNALLKKFLKEHEGEVRDIMYDYIFNDELLMEIHIESEMRKAREKGLETGLKKGMAKGLAKGMEEGLAKGIEEGLTKGLEEGRKEGHIKGVEEGIQQKAVDIAKKMLDMGLTVDQIVQATELTSEQVSKLVNN